MKALVYDNNQGGWDKTKGFWLMDLPEPKLGEQENDWVIIKMKYAGFCGSDRGMWNRSSFGPLVLSSLKNENKDIRIIGHELLGEIVEVGSEVKDKYNFAVGDIVSAESHITCGKCYQCLKGDNHVCADDIIFGIAQDGCFAEYVKLPAKILWPTDINKIEPEVAAMQEPFGNAVHACTQVDLKDKTIAVFGCGAIGSMSIIIAKGMGAKKIIAVDMNEANLQLAEEIGADEVIKLEHRESDKPWAHNEDVIKKIKELTGGVGVDVAMEMAGPNMSVNNVIQSVCRGGHVVWFGLKSGDFVVENFEKMIRNGVQIHSVIGRQIWQTWEMTRKLLEDKTNGVQMKIKKFILKDYQGSVVDFGSFDREKFEKKLKEFPKLIFKF